MARACPGDPLGWWPAYSERGASSRRRQRRRDITHHCGATNAVPGLLLLRTQLRRLRVRDRNGQHLEPRPPGSRTLGNSAPSSGPTAPMHRQQARSLFRNRRRRTQPAEGTAQSQQPGPMGTGQSAVEAVANAIADNDLPGDLGALLNDDLFSQIFDVDVLFDPFLKSLRDSVEDVGIAELRKQAQIVTACLYAVDNASPAEQDAA